MRYKDILTTGQVAKLCKVAPRTVCNWCDGNKLKYYRIPLSEDRRVQKVHLIEFMKEYGMPVPKFLELPEFLIHWFTGELNLGRAIELEKPDVVVFETVFTSDIIRISKLLPAEIKPFALVGDDIPLDSALPPIEYFYDKYSLGIRLEQLRCPQ